MSHDTGYYMLPTLHGDTLVFLCEDDLWTVSAAGGVARRLTTAPGSVQFPVLSPDGSRLAYAARDDGPQEIYVMDARGGPSQRLTHLGGLMTQPVAWSADGRRVVFRSNAQRPFGGQMFLYEVEPGGHPRELPFGPARALARQPGGPGIVLGHNSGDPARWKRYRGGTAGRLWIDRRGDGSFRPLVTLDGNLAAPMWIGKRIWFLSDHEGHGNLYSCTPTGRGLRRHTDHEDYYARFPQTDGRRIVYHAGADLWLHDPASGESVRLDVSVHSSRHGRARRFVDATRYLEGARLHPAGHSVALSVRGGAYGMALWEGAPRRHGPVSEARRRLVRWLPDGKRLVMVADDAGEEGLVVCKADGTGRPKRIAGDIGRPVDAVVAPAGADRVALCNQRNQVLLVDLDEGRVREVERSPHDRIRGLAWSPDGRWLAYGFHVSLEASALHLYDTRRDKVHEITRPDFLDVAPSFDPDGKYLYFLSHRVFDPVMDNQYFQYGFPRGVKPCLLTLAKDTPSPFSDAQREPRSVAPGPKKDEGAKKPPARTVVHLKGIRDRVLAFPVEERRYTSIVGARGRALFTYTPVEGFLGMDWASSGAPPAKQVLRAHDFESGKTETLIDGVSGVSATADGRSLLVRVGNRLRALPAGLARKEIPAKDEAGRESGWIDLDRLRVEVEPGAEWGQMFDEAWRLQRDQFWEPGMGGMDWQEVHGRYRPLVERVATRSEFSDLLWELQGELGTSHCYEMGGDYRPRPSWYQGLLGADLAWAPRRRCWVVRRIPRGDSWVREHASPLAAPGVDVAEGDEILAVNGTKLGARVSPAMCLVNEANRPVTLTLRRKGKRRHVTVETLGGEQMLRYRDWVEANRAHVHRATRGKVGYVHVPNMGPWGFSEFHRYYKQEVDRPGLIVDVRYNGGGHVSQLLLERLRRRRVGYDCSRYRSSESYPAHAPMGPMVCLTNEFAGSDGDIFSHAWKLYGLGPLIGKRTWGGVVGIWPRFSLVDGTVTTQPEFASFFLDVGWGVENHGTDPDVDVDIGPQDWAAGRDPQMERALAEVQELVRRTPPQVPDMRAKPDLRPPRLPRG
jgi:tricorn protease